MIEFKVNSTTVEFDGDDDTPLLWVLRDHVRLTGTKFGCGIGQCGACTIHVDGRAQRSCITPVSSVAGRDITTIEGLAPSEDELHPVQQAWLEHDVPQCGYCQSGQIMSAAALLENNPNPSEADVEAAMSGNLCRCGCYPRIKGAIMATAASELAYDAAPTTGEVKS